MKFSDFIRAPGPAGPPTQQGIRALGFALLTEIAQYLGLGSMAQQNANNVAITGGSVTGITDLAVADGGTGASTATTARSNLGLGSIATQAANGVAITGGSITGITDLAVADGGTGASTGPAARINLGLGGMATQDPANVNISGGNIAGITDLAIADGGTGASTAANARTNLGLGTAAVEAANSFARFTTATTEIQANLPIGSIITFYRGSLTELQMHAVVSLSQASGNAYANVAGSGTALTGTWQICGRCGQDGTGIFYVAQRTA